MRTHELKLVETGGDDDIMSPARSTTLEPLGAGARIADARLLRVLSIAATCRFEDEAREAERLAILDRALDATRAMSAALQTWLRQCVSEYRGTRSRWDVVDTAAHVQRAIDDFHDTSDASVVRLLRLVPDPRDVTTEPAARCPDVARQALHPPGESSAWETQTTSRHLRPLP